MPCIRRTMSFILRTMLLAGVLLGLWHMRKVTINLKTPSVIRSWNSERIDTAESELRGLRRRLEELGTCRNRLRPLARRALFKSGKRLWWIKNPRCKRISFGVLGEQGSSLIDSLQVVDGENLDPGAHQPAIRGEVPLIVAGMRFYRSPDFDKGIIIEGKAPR